MMLRLKTNNVLLALILILAPQLAAAQTSESLAGIFACEALTEPDAELACFRTETAKLREAGVTITPIGDEAQTRVEPQSGGQETAGIPQATPQATPQAKDNDPEKFIPLRKDETPKKRTLTIQSAQPYGRNGYIRFNLENGEVWQQTERGRLRLGKANPDKLTIKKGALGSFLARVNDKAPSIRVKRVK